MTIFKGNELELAKGIFRRNLHNDLYTIKKAYTGTAVDDNPLFKSDVNLGFTEYDNFEASVFEVLSGKINRLFEERNLPILETLGSVNKEVFIVNYVPNQEIATGIIVSLEVDDEIELNTGDWYRVLQVVPDSQGLQEQAIVTK